MFLKLSPYRYIRVRAQGFDSLPAMISEQQLRTIIYYEWRQKNNVSRATANINKAFGESTVSRWTVNRWFNRFTEGDTSLQNDDRSGRPSSLDNDELERAIQANAEATTRELETILGCSKTTINAHLHALGYRRVQSRWIPHRLTDAQK